MKQQIADRITAGYADLSPQEQRAADVVLDHLEDLAVYSSAELAEVAGVSRATFSRLYRHLGFESSTEVKELARVRRSQGVPVAVDDDQDHDAGAIHLDGEHRNLAQVFAPGNLDRLDAAAQTLTDARRVVVMGWRNSYPVAMHLRTQLAQARESVRLAPAPGQTVGEELLDLGPQDLVVVIGFRRSPHGFESALAGCLEAQVPVMLIADGSARHHAGAVQHWLEAPVERTGAFDSYATAFSLVAWLADAVLRNGGSEASRRVDRATSVFQALTELETR